VNKRADRDRFHALGQNCADWGQKPTGPAEGLPPRWRSGFTPTMSAAMRPDLLNPLFAEAASLKGVGPGLARPLERLR
jgi:hypothetical protein